jgi:phosphatidylserine decarboxylase
MMGGNPQPLPVWDRKAGKLAQEFMEDSPATYDSLPRRSITQWLESRPLYDWLVAAYQDGPWSVRAIQPFIAKHHIDLSDFKPVIYRSFADFFCREFRPGIRSFPSNPDDMGAFAEARYFGWAKINRDQQFPIKGYSLSAKRILGDRDGAKPFEEGPVILARLSPMDYHHAHYLDEGTTVHTNWKGGPLWTVNWRALLNQPDILFRNHRQVSILETSHFGRIAFVEVGAMSVGRIVQVHRLDQPFSRGDEKSFFKFGGSAIVLFGRAGSWMPSEDIIENTKKGIETRVLLGDVIAHRL